MVSLNDVLLAMSNIPVDDPIAEIWGRGLQGGHEIIEYTGELPITITADGTALIDYCIYGNAVQNGTPTPENPIVVEGVGERVDITGLSEPLCGVDTYTDSLDLSTGILARRIKKLVLTGKENWIDDRFPLSNTYLYHVGITDLINVGNNVGLDFICTHFKCGKYYGVDAEGIQHTFKLLYIRTTETTLENWKSYLAAQYAAGTPVTVWYVLEEPEVSTITVPSGLTGTIEGYLIQDGTPTPETPIYPIANGIKQADGTYVIHYGYKLPITVNGMEHPIYLGQAETTRRIKKVVLTGEEGYDWFRSSTRKYSWYTYASLLGTIEDTPFYCSHGETVTNASDFIYGTVYCDNTCNFGIFDSSINSVAKVNNYLAQQYANGTPVTVWCVLAEPKTAVVNEPLMKIGDYADTLSMEQADVSIPTFVGTTVIDYDGAPKPSQMYIKYRR